MSADAPAAELNYTPKPALASSTADSPSAQERVDSIQEQFNRNMEGIFKQTGPLKGLAAENIFKAQAEETQANKQALVAGQEYATPRPIREEPQFHAQPPVRDVSARPFMDNPQAKDTLGNVVSLLGTMAQMAMAGRAPVAALNAFSGAMTGWAEGDRVRAQREWQQYLGQVDKINAENLTAQRAWENSMRVHGANELAARARYIVALDSAGLKERATLAAQGNMKDILDMEQRYIGVAERLRTFSMDASKYVLDHALKEQIRQQNYQLQLDTHDRLREELKIHRRRLGLEEESLDLRKREVGLKEKDAAGPMGGLDPAMREQVMEGLAAKLRAGEDPQVLFKGFGGKASMLMMEAQDRALKQRVAAGDTPEVEILSRRFLQANTNALKQLTKQEAEFKAFLGSYEKALANTDAMVEAVEKSGLRVWDRKLLWLEANFNGNTPANNLLSQMEILSQETARVLARARGVGAERSKEEARKITDASLSNEQWRGLRNTVLKPDAMAALGGYEEEKRALMEKIADPLKAAREGLQKQGTSTTPPQQSTAPKLPPHTRLEGGQLVSEDGKYMWKDGKWQNR